MGEEILPSDQSRIIEQAKFTYSHLGKAFEKQMKTTHEQAKIQVECLKCISQKLTIKDVILQNAVMNLIKLKKQRKTVDREKIYYRTIKYTFNFQNFRTISTFGRYIYKGNITTEETDEDQKDLLVENLNFKKKAKRTSPEKKQYKKGVLKNLYNLFKCR